MIQDPCHLLKFLNRLTYFDKLKIPIVKSFLFNAFLNRYDNLDLSSVIDITDFQCNKEKNSVLLIGNATSKNIYSSIIDSFDGDVIRFNRFETGDEYGLGKKVTRWAIARNFLFDKADHGNELDVLMEKNIKNSVDDIDIFLANSSVFRLEKTKQIAGRRLCSFKYFVSCKSEFIGIFNGYLPCHGCPL